MIATTTELLSISKFPKCSEAIGKDVRAVSSVEELVSRIDSEGRTCVWPSFIRDLRDALFLGIIPQFNALETIDGAYRSGSQGAGY
jgi:hypothetical protein